jgi:6-phosphogluconolactonase (cycloisomerase 2 family)
LINGIGNIWYISLGHDSKLYVADAVGDLFSVEDETGKLLHYLQLNTMIDFPRLFATNNLEQFLLKQIA